VINTAVKYKGIQHNRIVFDQLKRCREDDFKTIKNLTGCSLESTGCP